MSAPIGNAADRSQVVVPSHDKESVMVVGNFLSASLGIRSVCEDLATRLEGMGRRVHTTSSKPGRVSRLLNMLSTVWSKRNSYKVAQVDVYSGPAFVWAEAVCFALRILRKPYLLTLHGGNLPSFARRWPWRIRRLLRSAVTVTTPSHYLLEKMKTYREDLQLLPNSIDVGLYNFTLRTNPKPRLIWLRSFHQIYNPTLAVRVLALLTKQFPDIELVMVGPDRGDGSLQKTVTTAERLGVFNRIQFVGGVAKSAVAKWLNQGDIFLNTTNFDNTPVSVIEAMACGLCVVSTNVGGLPYLLEHNCNALLVPADAPDAMADAIRQTLTQQGLSERLSSQARKTVEQFDWSLILPQWDRLLTAAIQNRRTS